MPARRYSILSFLLLVSVLPVAAVAGEGKSLFNGKDLTNWEGDTKFWRVEDGTITAGNTSEKFPHNDFLASQKSYENFDLRLKIKLTGSVGFVNSGVQFRSVRVPKSSEMSGYQADSGEGYWGDLYDETRRGKLVKAMNKPELDAALKKNDWNDYRIRADGQHIELWINGVKTMDYTEKDVEHIPLDGYIGLQIHGNGKTQVYFKDITIEELPPTPDALTWEKIGGYKPWPKKKK
jgi:hypothetical protein